MIVVAPEAAGRTTSPMSPVAPRKERNPRTMVLAVAGVVLALVLAIVVFVFAVPSLSESGKVKVRLGSDTFDAGLAAKRGRRRPPQRAHLALRRVQRPTRTSPAARR